MSGADPVQELIARIVNTQQMLQRIAVVYRQFLDGDFQLMGKKNTSAIVIAELMVDYYTCVETLFLRISQFFDNHLDADRWHSDLLEKMVLRIEGVRDPVLAEGTARDLGELMRFRHLRRYYFELECDWDKLEYMQKVFARVNKSLPSDLERFKSFLGRLT